MKKSTGVGMALCVLVLATGCGGESVDDENTATASAGAALASPALRSVALSTGVTLQYLEQGRPNGAPLILLHGYTDSHRSFDLDLPLLPDGYHVYALDQRGHGGSSKPECCYAQANFGDDVIAFMDRLGIRRATLVGHSMGSFIAHKVAAEHPSRVENLVLIGSAPTVAGNAVVLDFGAEVEALTDPIDPEFVREFQASTFYRPIPASFLDTAVSESLRVPSRVWKAVLAGLLAEDHTAELGEIRAPTAVFWGDKDGFFSANDEARLVAAIPHAKLFVYRDTGHGLHVEQPRRFVDDLRFFLR